MTKLMKQLQAWANEGRYDWENGTFKWVTPPFPKLVSCYQNPEENRPDYVVDIMRNNQLVLDGTIKVWRPFEYYYPEDDEPIMVCTLDDKDSIEIPSGVYCEPTGGAYFKGTHWQPLPEIEGRVVND